MSRFTHSTSISTAQVRRFARHYLEMVIAMFAGMVLLGLPAEGVLQLFGTGVSGLRTTAPAVVLLGMGFVMTVPMVAWMRYRGHTWQPSLEMASSMIVPTIAVIALLAAGVTDFAAAMAIEHVAMLPAMLAVMLMRWDEYSESHTHHAAVAEAAA
jgi:hypothetical protein